MRWHELELTVLDFEGCRRTGIVELGMVTLRGGAIVDTYSRLCRPKAPIDPTEARIHGIAQAEAEAAEPFTAEWERLQAARQRGLLAAHHAHVEQLLLRDCWPYPRVSPGFGIVADAPDWGPWLDTRRIAEIAWPGLSSYALGELIIQFQLTHKLSDKAQAYCPASRRKAHCALFDALASALMLIHLSQQPGYGDMPLAWLIQASQPKASEASQGLLF